MKQLCVFRLIEGLVVVNFQIAANLSENIAGSTDVMKIRSQLHQNLSAPAGCMFCLEMVSLSLIHILGAGSISWYIDIHMVLMNSMIWKRIRGSRITESKMNSIRI